MRIYYGLGQIKRKFRRPVLTIGIFDGVHRGHRFIIKKIVERAHRINGTSTVLTFYPHPYHILRPRKYLPLLISLEHRIRLIANLGVDVCIVQEFTEKFSQIDNSKFIKNNLVNKIHPAEIFVGKDFSFGKNKAGNNRLLTRLAVFFNYKVKVVSPRISRGKTISSTLIRSLIKNGNLKMAADFLGRPVSVFGRIVKGSKRGKILGFPTANIDYNHEVLPPKGVYAVKIKLAKSKFFGVANIGLRPSFQKRKGKGKGKVIMEVHIFDFNKRIYGSMAEVEFIKKIRREKKFKSESGLIDKIRNDVIKARQILKLKSIIPS